MESDKDMLQKHIELGIEIGRFLERGGEIQQILPQYRGFKKSSQKQEREICEKCRINNAEKRFTDDEGNKYYWCEECYEQ